FALGRPGEPKPWTEYASTLALQDAINVASVDKKVVVFARDELGNTSSATVDLGPVVAFHGTGSGDGGCGCASADASAGSLGGMELIAAFTALMLLGFRRVARAAYKVGPYALFILV